MAILLAYLYFYFAYGYFSVIVLYKLTKASFKLDRTSIFDLFVAYFFALMMTIVLYIHIPQSSKTTIMDPTTGIFLGIILVYLGRMITKNLGVFYGKVHFSALFLTGGVLILYRTLSALGFPDQIGLINFYINSLDGITYFISAYQYQIVISFFAAIILSIVGEFLLSILKPKERKLISVLEKMPSGFLTYTGLHQRNISDISKEITGEHHGLLDKIEEILKPSEEYKIESIRCVVKSLWIIEQIDDILGKNNALKNNILVIKRPDRQAIFEYIDRTFERAPSLDILYDGREKSIDSFIHKYGDRIKRLKNYKARDYDLDELAFLLTEYDNGVKCLLLIVFDTGPRMNRVGLYTEESYIIDAFANLFDSAWKIAEDYDPDNSDILNILSNGENTSLQKHVVAG